MLLARRADDPRSNRLEKAVAVLPTEGSVGAHRRALASLPLGTRVRQKSNFERAAAQATATASLSQTVPPARYRTSRLHWGQ